MKYFMVEGNILDAGKINDCIMKEHMSYTQAAMDQDIIFLSGLKTDMSGVMPTRPQRPGFRKI